MRKVSTLAHSRYFERCRNPTLSNFCRYSSDLVAFIFTAFVTENDTIVFILRFYFSSHDEPSHVIQ